MLSFRAADEVCVCDWNPKLKTHTHPPKIGFVVHVGFEPITVALTFWYFRKTCTCTLLSLSLWHESLESKSTSAQPTSPSADAEPETREQGSPLPLQNPAETSLSRLPSFHHLRRWLCCILGPCWPSLIQLVYQTSWWSYTLHQLEQNMTD